MKLAEEVVDASVIGAAFFNEAASDSARAWLINAPRLVAPDLLYAEIASIAAKKVWRGEASMEAGARSIEAIDDFVAEAVPLGELAGRAFDLASQHRCSAYDGAYLALAERRDTRLVTLDRKLIDRATQAGLGHLLRELKP